MAVARTEATRRVGSVVRFETSTHGLPVQTSNSIGIPARPLCAPLIGATPHYKPQLVNLFI